MSSQPCLNRGVSGFLILFIINVFISDSLFSQTISPEKYREIAIEFEPPKELTYNFFPEKRIVVPSVGLALSGGGMRGISHIGVLQALEDNEIPIDCIAGTSMGSVIGGLYAIGYHPEEIKTIAKNIDWTQVFKDRPSRQKLLVTQKEEASKRLVQLRMEGLTPYIPPAYSQGQRIRELLDELVLRANSQISRDFDDFKVRFRSVATNLLDGKKVSIGNGNLGEAIMASIAMPLLFTPVKIDTFELLDGGLVENIPVREVKNMGADIIIAVDVTSSLRNENELKYPWQQADQIVTIMQNPINEQLRKMAHIVIDPNLDSLSTFEFDNFDNIIEAGRKVTVNLVDSIKKLIDEKYLSFYSDSTIDIAQIRMANLENLNPEIFNNKLKPLSNSKVSISKLKKYIADIYNTGFFSDIKIFVEKEYIPSNVIVYADENPVIEKFNIIGNEIFSDSVFVNLLKPETGRVFNYHRGKVLFQGILRLYRKHGFSLANVEDCDFDTSSGVMNIYIDEGKIGDIKIKGTEKTKDFVILREFPLKKGDIFNINYAKDGIDNIYSTGLFHKVHLSIDYSNPGRELIIDTIEKRFSILRFGAHYNKDEKGKGFVEYVDDNLFGFAVKSNLYLQYGERDQLYQYSLRSDRIYTSNLNFKLRFRYTNRMKYTSLENGELGEYRDKRYGVTFSFGEQVRRLGLISIEGRVERTEITTFPVPDYNKGMEIRSLIFRSIVDTKDKYPFPSSGKYHHMYYETATGEILEGTVSYIKLFTSLESFYTYKGKYTFHPKVIFGFADNTLPFSEMFRMGGSESFYGYYRDQLFGRIIALGNFEFRNRIPIENIVDTYLSFRYDIGAVWYKQDKISINDFIHGFGISVAVDFPIGPVEIAYGIAKEAKLKRLYFSLGHKF